MEELFQNDVASTKKLAIWHFKEVIEEMVNPGSYYPSHQMPIKDMRCGDNFYTTHLFHFSTVLDKKKKNNMKE